MGNGAWIQESRHPGRFGSRFLEQLEHFPAEGELHGSEAGQIAAGPCEACYDSCTDRIIDLHEDDRSTGHRVPQCEHDLLAGRQAHLWLSRCEVRSVTFDAPEVGCGPAII